MNYAKLLALWGWLVWFWRLLPEEPGKNYGHFLGEVWTRWVHGDPADPDDRYMVLLHDFAFLEPDGTQWLAPTGARINGASIPRVFWSITGGPYEGRYRRASVIHDVACDQQTRTWQDTHKAFYHGMLADGAAPWLAWTMWLAVYLFGPRW